jgi:hypothetical protein
MRRGIPAEQFEKDKKELFANARQTAEKRIKVQLLLAKIAEKEKIEVTAAAGETGQGPRPRALPPQGSARLDRFRQGG